MAAFIEERFPEDIEYGSGFATKFAAETITTAGGNEYRALRHPFLQASLDVDFTRQRDDVIKRIVDLNMRAGGTYRGFRVKNYMDFSTNFYRGNPTPFDQAMLLVSGTTYQIMRWYGSSSDPECSRRRIRKPVINTVQVGVGGTTYPPAMYAVDYTTGMVTLNSNKTGTITGITKGSTTVITVANSMTNGDSVLITGCAGMTQINGLRAVITARTSGTITVAINSTGFSNYTSGGTVNTAPQSGESVTAGCLFDIPMRFDADLSGTFTSYGILGVSGVGLSEILNP